jgi:cytoskeletal protein CcmA (bactofilin family)
MARSSATRTVQCYHCRHPFEVGGRAMSTSCPGCNKAVIVQDVIVTGLKTTQKLQTCGRVVIKARGRVIAGFIEAQGGVEVLGALHGNVTSSGPVIIGAKGRWKGDCHAPSLQVKLGARIESGYFQIPGDQAPEDDQPPEGDTEHTQ